MVSGLVGTLTGALAGGSAGVSFADCHILPPS
jgi:hypothetical protein